MTRELVAAMSGWGKSWTAQARIEEWLDRFDYVILADYKDEYRGLAKYGSFSWAACTHNLASLSSDGWRLFIEDNPLLVVARDVPTETWQTVVARIATAMQELKGDGLVAIDEAHFLAPQKGTYPEAIKRLATTGRGNGVASMWISQRLQEMDETPISQADARLLGGFESDRDRAKIAGYIPYDVSVHDPAGEDSLQRYPADSGGLEGSEWMYSNTNGEQRRVDTREWSMESTHYGGVAPDLPPPEES